MSYAEQEALVPNLVAKVKALESELATTRARLEAAEAVCLLWEEWDRWELGQGNPPRSVKDLVAVWRSIRSEAEGGEKP